MRWYTIKEASKLSACSEGLLRLWSDRYGWPDCVRKANGYRLFSEVVVAEVREFIFAGRPFHQLDCGQWNRPGVARPVPARPTFLATFAELDQRFLTALHVGDMGTVAHWLAAMPTWHPRLRARYVECAQIANRECGGVYLRLLRRFGFAEPMKQESQA